MRKLSCIRKGLVIFLIVCGFFFMLIVRVDKFIGLFLNFRYIVWRIVLLRWFRFNGLIL